MYIIQNLLIGVLFANGIPHFVAGILGQGFHTPFSKPRTNGYSSPIINMVWGLSNFVVTGILMIFTYDQLHVHSIIFGFIVMSIGLSIIFSGINKGK